MHNYRELLHWGITTLSENGIESADVDAWLLMSWACGMSRTDYYMGSDKQVPQDKARAYTDAVNERASRIPLQYIEGTAPFMGYDFIVDENVLIPRMDTEVLVETVMKKATVFGSDISILDMCTGSGCIIESLYLELTKKGFNVAAAASDISDGALSVAKKNAENLNAKVHFFKGNLFENVEGKYDIIVSNPPYIPPQIIVGLEPEVREHEPMLALFGGEDGLDFYRRIVEQAAGFLNNRGLIAFEIGHDQAEAVGMLLEQAGFADIEVTKDLAGLDRVVTAFWAA